MMDASETSLLAALTEAGATHGLLFSLVMTNRLLCFVADETSDESVRQAATMISNLWSELEGGRTPTRDEVSAMRTWVEMNGPTLDGPYVARHYRELFVALHATLDFMADGDTASLASISKRCLQVPWAAYRKKFPQSAVGEVASSAEYKQELQVQMGMFHRLLLLGPDLAETAVIARRWVEEYPLAR
jgi:hypothetical protein